MTRITTTEHFIENSKIKHNNKYIYDKANYINSHTNIEIICPLHGLFYQRPNNHLNGAGCKTCSIEKNSKNQTLTTKEFVDRSKIIHNNKFDYSLSIYKTSRQKIKIICPIHNVFEQIPQDHLRGIGCNECGNTKLSNKVQFITKAHIVHKQTYDYSEVDYINCKTYVKIICKIHGDFIQKPNVHLNGSGCKKCWHIKMADFHRHDKIFFIEKSKIIHNDFYNYSLVVYTSGIDKVRIICPKHGEFSQSAASHMRGIGCPKCSESKGEKIIRQYLEKYNIIYIFNKGVFNNCINPKTQRKLRFDFYLPIHNLTIEFDGQQHFSPWKMYDPNGKKLKYQQYKDKIKNEYCKKNGIRLLRIPFTDINNIDEILDEYLHLSSAGK